MLLTNPPIPVVVITAFIFSGGIGGGVYMRTCMVVVMVVYGAAV